VAGPHKRLRRLRRRYDRRVGSVVLVIGAPGAGKSSLLEALANELERERSAFGAFESEQLAWGYPLLAAADWVTQLEGVIAGQRAAGRKLLLIAATPESQADLDLLRRAAGPGECLTVCVLAQPATVAERLARREDPAWVGRGALIARARTLAALIPALTGIDVRLDSEATAARELARELLARPDAGPLTRRSRAA